MFGKVLKYDFKYIARFWWIIAASVLGLSVVASLDLRFIIENENTTSIPITLMMIAGVFFLFISIIAIFGSLIVTQVFIYIRFYKNFFTDEGYLTFTLPVSRKKLLLSKTLNALIFTTLHTLLIIVSVLIFITLAAPTAGQGIINLDIWKGLIFIIGKAWDAVGAWLIVYVLEALVLLVLLQMFSTCLVQLCITIGAVIAKKQKVLAAVGIYYITNSVLSIILSITSTLFLAGMIGGLVELLMNMSKNAMLATVSLFALLICLAVASAVCIVYNMTLNRIERRLNLA